MVMNPVTPSSSAEKQAQSSPPISAGPEGSQLKPKWDKIKSAGAAQSPLLGAAMFSPAVLYILLLIAAPFMLAIFYAFSDARIGSSEMHFVGLENFRSILQS